MTHNRGIRHLDTNSGPAGTRQPLRPATLAWTLGLFALLAVIHTWPLATAPSRLSRDDNADALLNQWILSWVAHQAPRDPLHLLDANIFHPDRGALAYSEYLIVPAAIGAPVLWLGGSPTLEYSLLILIGLTLMGTAGCVLVARWTGDLAAGTIAGVIFAFNAHTLTRLPQLQALHVEFLPLALLAFDGILAGGGSVWWLAAAVALQGVTSYYSLMLTLVALAAGWLVRPDSWRQPRVFRRVAAAAALSLLVLGPALIPYARLGQVRSLDEIRLYSASARDYLASPSRIHFGTWSARFFGGTTALFPGVTATLLALLAIVSGVALRDRRARMAIAFGAAGIAFSLGPALPGYSWLYNAIPPLQGIRNVARFGFLATVAASVLSGFAVAWFRRRCAGARWLPAAVAAVFVCANLDALSTPIDYVNAASASAVHARLRGTSAIVAEFPFYPPDRVFRQAPYLLHSTLHWRPMLNGYSGLTPESFVQHARELSGFPDQHAFETLRALGVTHVFVHDRALRDWTNDETADAVRRAPELQLIAEEGDVALYQLRLRGSTTRPAPPAPPALRRPDGSS